MFRRTVLASLSMVLWSATHCHGQNMQEGFTVPAFACFGATPTMKFDMTASESDLSGVTWNPATQTFFTVNNGDRKIYEIDFPNTLVQSWNVSEVTLDLEGITVLPPSTNNDDNDDEGIRGHFAITDENPASVITLTLHADGTTSNHETRFQGLPVAAASNLGFEGLAYLDTGNINNGNDTSGATYIIAQEASPTKLWQLSASTYEIQNITGDLNDHEIYQIRSVGGLTRGGDATDEVFVVVKTYTGLGRNNETYYQKGIFRYNLTSGQFTERFGGEVCNMGQPEGLTFWKNGTKIHMLVVGETYEALVYEAEESCTEAVGSLSDTMATCLKQVQSIAACEKTKEDGGCGWLRCDKDQTL